MPWSPVLTKSGMCASCVQVRFGSGWVRSSAARYCFAIRFRDHRMEASGFTGHRRTFISTWRLMIRLACFRRMLKASQQYDLNFWK